MKFDFQRFPDQNNLSVNLVVFKRSTAPLNKLAVAIENGSFRLQNHRHSTAPFINQLPTMKITSHLVSILPHLPKGIMTKTLIQNDGFQTLTISRQYTFEQIMGTGENVAPFKTTKVDLFLKDSTETICSPYGNIFGRGKRFDSVQKASNALPRKMQTEDYRNREHAWQIVKFEDGTASVFEL